MKLLKVFTSISLLASLHAIADAPFNPLPSGSQLSIIGPRVITQPGTYVLSFDIAGTVTIDADRVYLNLNKKQIEGGENNIFIATGHSDISIYNGVLSTPNTSGISGSEVTNLTLQSIDFIGGVTAILIDTATVLNFYDITVEQATSAGIVITDGETIVINNFKAENNNSSTNAIAPIQISSARNVTLSNLFINNNNSTNNAFVGIVFQNSQDIKVSQATISNCSGFTQALGLTFFACQKGIASDILVGNLIINTSGSLSAGIFTFQSIAIVFNNCQAAQLQSAGALGGFLFLESSHIQASNCKASGIQTVTDGAVGFFCINGNNAIYDHCISTSIFSSGASVFGFQVENYIEATLNSCISTDNISSSSAYGFLFLDSAIVVADGCLATDSVAGSTAYGFSLDNTNTSCIFNCIAKNNAGTDTGRGIYLEECLGCFVEKNIVASNTGGITGIGIEVFNSGIFSTSVFANQAQDHVSNYITSAPILTVDYDRATAVTVGTPTPLSNINIS